MKHHKKLLKMILAALFLAIAYVIPFLTGQIPEIGSMLCPMHIPILLCGFLCGPVWGCAVGLCAPLLRSVTLGMPPLFPTAAAMAFELAAYGFVCGIGYRYLPRRKPMIYVTLLGAMTVGRLIWGAAMYVCVGMSGGNFTLTAFLAGAVTNAIPGIAIQIVLVPILVMLWENTKLLKIHEIALL